MFHSAEIRWFLEGDVPNEIREWFSAAGMAVEEKPRVDEYLVLPGCTTTGVKFRQYPDDDKASFEIKARTSEPVDVSFDDTVRGDLDTWVTWSCRPTAGALLRDSIDTGDETWVFVEKRRSLRKFSTEGPDPVEVDPSTIRPGDGCQFELTAVKAMTGDRDQVDWSAAEQWWSLSFEAFGKPDRLREYVQSVSGFVLTRPVLSSLAAAESCSYPAWLLGIVARSKRS